MTKVSQYVSFDQLPGEVRTLFTAAAKDCFFNGLPWFELFSKYALDEGDKVRIYCASQGSSSGHGQAALAAVERAAESNRFKGKKLSSLSNYYSSLFAPVWSGLNSWEAARELAACIAQDTPKWDTIDLKPLDVSAPVFSALEAGLKSAGFVVQTYFCFGNWYLDVGGRTFSQYFDGLPSTLKNTVTRKTKKLEKSGRAKVEIVTGADGLEAAINAYNAVYAQSWKQPEPYPGFVPQLIRTCANLGVLRLGIVYYDDAPVASQFWIVQNGVALIYKLAYDERFKDLSAGSILTATLMQHAIDVDHVREVDYLTGDDSYKRDWMTGRRERWGLLAMNPRTVHGLAAIARHIAGRTVKRAIRSVFERLSKIHRSQEA